MKLPSARQIITIVLITIVSQAVINRVPQLKAIVNGITG